MNDNNSKKQRKFYTNCPLPECKEKITVLIDSSEKRAERKAEARLEEELTRHWIAKKHSWENTEGLEFKVVEETEENKPVENREREENNRPRNWGTHGNSPGINTVGGEWKCPKCGIAKIWWTNPNGYFNKELLIQEHKKSGECEERQQTDHYKCLRCGSQGMTSDLNGWCRCGSKNLEIRYDNFHFTIFECSDCHRVRDVKYYGLSPEHEAKKKSEAKLNWENNNEWCGCPRSNVSINNGEREREFWSSWNPTTSSPSA